MSEFSTDNQRIARNTMFLYVRQLMTMVLSLFTTGIVMRELGVEDYGLYNVIGGIVTIFSVLQGAMSVGTQRFLNFEMGKGDVGRVREVFNISLLLYYGIAVIVVILSETVGLWYLHNRLVVPEGRMFAAEFVFQASVISCVLSITQTPYSADIIANERMGIYGYLGVAESLSRFLLILLLLVLNSDKLILFAAINLLVGVVFRLLYRIYCKRNFAETAFRRPSDRTLLKEIVSFSGWNLLARVAYVGRDQGGALIVNRFFGVALNASMAVSANVSFAVSSFVNNFQTAYRPQLVKSYAAGDMKGVFSLFFFSSKISAFLILLFAVPAVVNMDYLLTIWLGSIPEKSQVMIAILLLDSFVNALFAPFWMTIFAMGDINRYQIMEGVFVLLNVPFMFLAFKSGLPIEWMYVIRLVLVLCLFAYATVYLIRKIEFPLSVYLSSIALPIIGVAAVCTPLLVLAGSSFEGLERLLITVPAYCFIFIPAFYFAVLSGEEKKKLLAILKLRHTH